MKTNVKKMFNVRQLTILGLMTALVMIFSFTPIGSIPVGPLVITLNVIPVAIAAVTCGPVGGAFCSASEWECQAVWVQRCFPSTPSSHSSRDLYPESLWGLLQAMRSR